MNNKKQKSEFQLRVASTVDLPMIAMTTWQILVETGRDHVYRFSDVARGVHQVLNGNREQDEYFVVQSGVMIAGQLKLVKSWSDLYNRSVAMIEHVYVHPHFRGLEDANGRRVYDHLHDHVIEHCQHHDIASVQLHVVSDNDRAKRAYVKRGMNATGFWMTQKLG